MPELFLELFSEEIPARMQARAAEDLARLVAEALAPLSPVRHAHLLRPAPHRPGRAGGARGRRQPARTERGPRANAPEQALAGFLRKHGATPRAACARKATTGCWTRPRPRSPPPTLIAGAIPPLLRRFPWPKSMRWGGASGFTWVRPLRRIVCLLDGAVVPFDLRDGDDDGHGLAVGRPDRGPPLPRPRRRSPSRLRRLGGRSCATRRVLVDAEERKRHHRRGHRRAGRRPPARVVDDPGLLDEVAGLVEWPVPLLGRIDRGLHGPAARGQAGLDAGQPALLRVPQRRRRGRAVFRLRRQHRAGRTAAPPSIAGNERVLRARFADARHFWDLDRKARLELPRAAAGPRDVPRQAGQPGRAGAPAGAPGRGDRPAGRRRSGAGRATPRGWPRPTWSPAWWASSPNCKA